MALKDWKQKETIQRETDRWESRDDTIIIYPAKYLTHAKTGFLVLAEKSNNPKYFRTKSQALKFAKAYMRSH